MASFIYFIPGVQGLLRGQVKRYGLAYAFPASAPFATRRLDPGPAGGGVLVATTSEDCHYNADAQTWQDCGRYWLGYETEKPPGPDDLKRPEQIDGHRVMLADGNEWLIPVAREMRGKTKFPKRLAIGPDCKWVTVPMPEYAALFKRAEEVFDAYMEGGEGKEVTIADLNFFCDALALNYRVSAREVSALGLLTTANQVQAVGAVIDWPTLLEAAESMEKHKKKVDATTSPNGGEQESGQETTSPPVPT